MKIGYLMNTYPLISTTFIRREIESLESLGLDIQRYGVRQWHETLVDPLDIAEVQKTHYLLTNNIAGLFAAFMVVLLTNFSGFLKASSLWWKVCRNAGGVDVKHIAYLLEAAHFYRITRRDGIQHVHTHFATNATTVAMLAQAMGGVSYSFTSHGPDEFVDPTLISMGLKIRYAKFVVAISNYCRVQLVRFSSFDYWKKIHIVHCGLKIDDFIPDYTFSEDNQNLICVGRLCPQKGQFLIPEALAELRQEFPGLKVHFVGDGESRAALEKAIDQYDVRSLVELHGWKSNQEVRQLITQGRAFFLPSFAEGLPVVIMEAFALGRPVISTFIAGIPELVDSSCGWLLPAGSVDGMVNATRMALTASPAELSEMGKKGRRRVEEEHNLKKIAQQLCELYTKV